MIYAHRIQANEWIQLHGEAAAAAKNAGVKQINVSISHSDTQAIAVAVSAF
jgi:fatty acid synthase subunit alpha, fungi type